MVRRAPWLAVLWVVACDAGAVSSVAAPAKGGSVKGREASGKVVAAAAERTFGARLSAQGEPVEVAAILKDPSPWLGKTIKARGVVARVCERAGCWLELKPEQGGGGLHVPMAGHAFFIPADVAGHVAVVEGQLRARELSASHRAHLEGEGARAVGPLTLEARGVLVP